MSKLDDLVAQITDENRHDEIEIMPTNYGAKLDRTSVVLLLVAVAAGLFGIWGFLLTS